MDSQELQPVITVSGFGPFVFSLDNPTMRIVNSLTEEELTKYNVKICKALEVSTVGVDEHIKNICKIKREPQQRQVNLHFGVYAGSQAIQFEQFGYNQKNFSIPDVRGQLFFKQPICELDNDYPISSDIDIKKLVIELKARGFEKLKISNDSGRYICNYIYFCSLLSCTKRPLSSSLFVHFPNFDVVSEEQQKLFVLNLLELVSDKQYLAKKVDNFQVNSCVLI